MDSLNDFPAVTEVESSAITETKLWNPRIFVWISVFFSFLPAAILYSLNYGRLGDKRRRNITIAASIVLFAATIATGILFTGTTLKYLFYGLNIGAGIYMQQDQLEKYKGHIINGGRKASAIVPVIICIAFIALFIFAVIYNTGSIPDKSLKINGDELYYTNNIKADEAKKLGDYLSKEILVNDNKEISVKIDKKSDVYVFSLVINKDYINDENMLDSLRTLGQQISSNVFNNSKVELDLCDDRFNPIKVLNG